MSFLDVAADLKLPDTWQELSAEEVASLFELLMFSDSDGAAKTRDLPKRIQPRMRRYAFAALAKRNLIERFWGGARIHKNFFAMVEQTRPRLRLLSKTVAGENWQDVAEPVVEAQEKLRQEVAETPVIDVDEKSWNEIAELFRAALEEDEQALAELCEQARNGNRQAIAELLEPEKKRRKYFRLIEEHAGVEWRDRAEAFKNPREKTLKTLVTAFENGVNGNDEALRLVCHAVLLDDIDHGALLVLSEDKRQKIARIIEYALEENRHDTAEYSTPERSRNEIAELFEAAADGNRQAVAKLSEEAIGVNWQSVAELIETAKKRHDIAEFLEEVMGRNRQQIADFDEDLEKRNDIADFDDSIKTPSEWPETPIKSAFEANADAFTASRALTCASARVFKKYKRDIEKERERCAHETSPNKTTPSGTSLALPANCPKMLADFYELLRQRQLLFSEPDQNRVDLDINYLTNLQNKYNGDTWSIITMAVDELYAPIYAISALNKNILLIESGILPRKTLKKPWKKQAQIPTHSPELEDELEITSLQNSIELLFQQPYNPAIRESVGLPRLNDRENDNLRDRVSYATTRGAAYDEIVKQLRASLQTFKKSQRRALWEMVQKCYATIQAKSWYKGGK
ncbi:MAG: hypothetical protein JRC93_08125 [Deltaproteobacteria bacterium]|nr:hypothetical protein [Deltaproteobacteria bacterium]